MLEEELREELASWARSADRLPLPDIASLRGRVRRRRIRVGGVIAGLIVIAATTAVLATLPAAPPVPPISGPVAWYPAGPLPPADAGPEAAPYFIALKRWTDSPGVVPLTVDVFAWRTGTPIAVVAPPTPGGSFLGVAAAGDDRTFVVEEDGRDSKPAAFYELRLRPDGKPLPLTRLPIPAATMDGARAAATPNMLFDPVSIMGVAADKDLNNSFAVSPDGRKLAVAVAAGGHAAIDVVTLATGSVHEWRAGAGASAVSGMEVGWAGNRHVTFTWWVRKAKIGWGRVLRLLDTGSGSNLIASRVVVGSFKSLAGMGAGSLFHYTTSPDGTTIFAEYFGEPKYVIVQISVRTGRLVREILPPVRHSRLGPLCTVLWSDPSGHSVAATCGSGVESDLEQGIVTDGKLRAVSLHLPGDKYFYALGDFIAW
jgi:hypothetical protein